MTLSGSQKHNRSAIMPPPDLTDRFQNARFFFDFIFYDQERDSYNVNKYLEMTDEQLERLNQEMHSDAVSQSSSASEELDRHTHISTCWSLMGQYFARLAAKDGLTKLFNKIAFEDAMNDTIVQLERRKELDDDRRSVSIIDKSAALIDIDLDRFKPFNDVFSHAIGDQAIIEAANLLKTFIRPSDYAGRLGGDEFSLLLIDVDEEEAADILSRLKTGFEELSIEYDLNSPIKLSEEDLAKIGRDSQQTWLASDLTEDEYKILGLKVEKKENVLKVSVDASFGIAMFKDGMNAEQIEAEADRSMYDDKHNRKSEFAHYRR